MYRDSEDWELYNLETDPDQNTNLYHQPGRESILCNLLRSYSQTRMKLESSVAPRHAFA